MTDQEITDTLNQTFAWARQQGLTTVITNGIADVHHGGDTAANRASDDHRTVFLIGLVSDHERHSCLQVTLISLNDVFVRNA